MTSLQRTARLILFDLGAALPRLKGLFFLVPFALFWYVVLRIAGGSLAGWLQQPDGLRLAGLVFDRVQLDILFVQNPPVLSIFLLVALITLPVFAILAGLDQFSSDLGRGYFRLLATRCRRGEIFVAAYAVALLTLGGALTLALLAAVGVSLQRDAWPLPATLLYAARIEVILVVYAAALTGFMAVVSVLTRSAIAALFLAVCGYLFLLLLAAGLNHALPQFAVFHYLLPGALKGSLPFLAPSALALALATLALYAAVYTGLAWWLFRSARL